jgi:hypothetical protein
MRFTKIVGIVGPTATSPTAGHDGMHANRRTTFCHASFCHASLRSARTPMHSKPKNNLQSLYRFAGVQLPKTTKLQCLGAAGNSDPQHAGDKARRMGA